MSFLLSCPNCGPRDVSEFRYGGQILAVPVGTPGAGSNLPGPQRERWFHRFGCRRWLVAERDVGSNRVLRSEWLAGQESATEVVSGEEPPADEGSEP